MDSAPAKRPLTLALAGRAGLLAAAVLPVAAAIFHAPLVDDGAHDEALVNALGLGAAGLPSFDAFVAAPFLVLPAGTLVFRLALASALAAGAATVLIAVMARRLIAGTTGDRGLLAIAVAVAGALTATLSPVWQREACAPLSSAPLAAVMLAVALASLTAAFEPGYRLERARKVAVVAAGVGAVVVTYWLVRRGLGLRVVGGEVATVVPFDARRIASFFSSEVGFVSSSFAAAGAVVSILRKPSRPFGIGLVVITALAAAAIGAGVPFSPATVGPESYGSAALFLAAMARVFAAVAIAALVVWVRSLRVPLASASASMVALLSVAFPAMAFDETSLVADERRSLDRVDWSETVLGGVLPRTLIVFEGAPVLRRLMAATLAGEAPEGFSAVPLHDVGGRLVRSEIARSPELVPLLRDVTLTGIPSEVAMAKLAESRPLLVAFSERWDKPLARHLVAAGGFNRFEPEPRGVIERKKTLEALDPSLVSLARALNNGSATALARTTSVLLTSRANALTAAGERELSLYATAHAKGFDRTETADDKTPERAGTASPRTRATTRLRNLAKR